MNKILFFECNEITPSFIELFLGEGKMPILEKFLANSTMISTKADALSFVLDAWVEWYSIHTGMRYDEHHVSQQTQGVALSNPDIWHVLSERKLKTINFGSLNVKPLYRDGQIYLPDSFNHSLSYPNDLEIFSRYLAKEFRSDIEFSSFDYIKLFFFLFSYNLSGDTIKFIYNYIRDNLFQDSAIEYQKNFLHDLLKFDIFAYHLIKNRPHYASFFTNTISEVQRKYWREYEPEKFEFADHNPIKQKAIETTYIHIDNLIGELWSLARRNNMKLVIAGGLSQKLETSKLMDRHYYRPKHIGLLLKKLAIDYKECEAHAPHRFILSFDTIERREHALDSLKSCFILEEGKRKYLFHIEYSSETDNRFAFHISPHYIIPLNQKVTLKTDMYNFFDLFRKMDNLEFHHTHPEGILYYEDGLLPFDENKISTIEIFEWVKSNLFARDIK